MDFTGVALGAGVNQYMKMDEMSRQNKKLEMEKQLADQQLTRGNMELDRLRSFDNLNKERAAVHKAIASGSYLDDPTAQQWLANSNLNQGVHNDGTVTRFERGDNGYLMNTYKGDKLMHSTAPSADVLYGAADTYFGRQLSTLSPENYFASRKLDTEDRKTDAVLAHYSRPNYLQDGTGRIIGIDQQGNQIGTYGSARPIIGGGQTNHFVPLTGGYSYNQTTGGFHAPDGSRVTDPATLEKITKMGTPGKATSDGMKHVGGNIYSQNGQTYAWNEMDGTFKPANLPGQQPSLAMEDPRKPAQGTGLKTPEPKVSAQEQATAFSDKYKGWSRQKAGNDFIVVGPNGQRMWASDFDAQNGPNASLMLNYR